MVTGGSAKSSIRSGSLPVQDEESGQQQEKSNNNTDNFHRGRTTTTAQRTTKGRKDVDRQLLLCWTTKFAWTTDISYQIVLKLCPLTHNHPALQILSIP